MSATSPQPRSARPKFLSVLAGTSLFLVVQYAIALWRLSDTSGEMANKFSKLATDEYMGFLVMQNVQMLIAYVLLALTAALLLQPFVSLWTARSRHQSWRAIIVRSLLLTGLTHAFFTLRLVETRPYFLDVKDFGQWYYRLLEVIPAGAKPASLWAIFTLLPLGIAGFAAAWHLYHLRRRGRWLVAGTAVVLLGIYGILSISRAITQPTEKSLGQAKSQPKNVIIIGSDSLRGDLLGCAGYRPARSDGLAQGGVSPVIDSLAARSTRFEQCYTSIASTMESGVQLMSSQYPQSHGIRQMYPNKQTVAETVKRITPLPALLRQRGYDTAAIGDWCAGYYEVVPLGMEHLSVSSFDNFKIYMSQAVVMAHFVVPLYFDNPLGYQLFPQLLSFANFVTPDVVTQRVESRLASVATTQKPFFWHVFYSCNHLPYACPEPYNTLFADPDYVGKNRSKVEFDIESFISGTDLESKWKALPPPEMKQIRALYDGCTRKFDDCVGKILESLKANGLAENTIVVITSDHGDDHYEPGVTLGHGLTFNGGLQANRVPMIVHLPGAAPQVIPETVRLIDLIPSLADMIGQEKSTTWQGQSFANWIRKSEAPVFRPFYGETGFPFIQFSVPGVQRPKLPTMDELTYIDPNYNFQFVVKDEYLDRIIQAKQRCLKTRHWKLVCTPTAAGSRHFALYQMTLDPQAMTDLATQRSEILAPLQAALVRWMDEKHESSIAEIFPSGEPQ